jgi:hypothetical protein
MIHRREFLKTTFATFVANGLTSFLSSSRVLAADEPSTRPSTTRSARAPKCPLFRDPIFEGSTDPTLIYNRDAKQWWMFYTARRANVQTEGVAWVHGTDIGIASSTDGGRSWLYRGTAQGLNFEPGRNTYWAPEIIWHDGLYHMYVSYITGVPTAWVGNRDILHYTSKNLWEWQFVSLIELSSHRVIDACVWPKPGGGWRMWYKDEARTSHIFAADSPDLNKWKVVGPAITNRGQEGPNVFHHAGAYWMITDMWRGLAVYRSDDLQAWTEQRDRLLATPGKRPTDDAVGHHAFCLSQGDDAYLFYFTEPDKRLARIQVAPLTVQDNQLTCDRDAVFELDLDVDRTSDIRGGTQST